MTMTNDQIARRLREHAAELSHDGANLYRTRAFRQAAMAVLGLTDEAAAVVAGGGRKALATVPGIGASLADTIAEYASSGVWRVRTDPPRRGRGPGLARAG